MREFLEPQEQRGDLSLPERLPVEYVRFIPPNTFVMVAPIDWSRVLNPDGSLKVKIEIKGAFLHDQ